MVAGPDGPVIRDGLIRVPDALSLGMKLNEEVAREYALKGSPFRRGLGKVQDGC